MNYDMQQFGNGLAGLLARAQAGEDVVLTKDGMPVAKLVPVRIRGDRLPGSEAGRIWIADDFDAPLPDDLLDAFEGKG